MCRGAEEAGGCTPRLDTYVFVRVKKGFDGDIDMDGIRTPLVGGELHVMRYPSIQALVGEKLELM